MLGEEAAKQAGRAIMDRLKSDRELQSAALADVPLARLKEIFRAAFYDGHVAALAVSESAPRTYRYPAGSRSQKVYSLRVLPDGDKVYVEPGGGARFLEFGCTATAAIVQGRWYSVANVGDSLGIVGREVLNGEYPPELQGAIEEAKRAEAEEVAARLAELGGNAGNGPEGTGGAAPHGTAPESTKPTKASEPSSSGLRASTLGTVHMAADAPDDVSLAPYTSAAGDEALPGRRHVARVSVIDGDSVGGAAALAAAAGAQDPPSPSLKTASSASRLPPPPGDVAADDRDARHQEAAEAAAAAKAKAEGERDGDAEAGGADASLAPSSSSSSPHAAGGSASESAPVTTETLSSPAGSRPGSPSPPSGSPPPAGLERATSPSFGDVGVARPLAASRPSLALVAATYWGQFVTPRHNLFEPSERARIAAHPGAAAALEEGPDGYATVVSGKLAGFQLAMSRALGHRVLSRLGVIPVPDVSKAQLPTDAVLLTIASDGIWEVLSPAEATRIVCDVLADARPLGDAVLAMVRTAVQRAISVSGGIGADNTTAAVFLFDDPPIL